MKERRNDKRKKASALVYYNVENGEGTLAEQGMAKALDLSNEGAHLEFSRAPKTGEAVNLTVSVGDEMVDLKGTTVWSTGQEPHVEAGLQVDNPPTAYKDMLSKLP